MDAIFSSVMQGLDSQIPVAVAGLLYLLIDKFRRVSPPKK